MYIEEFIVDLASMHLPLHHHAQRFAENAVAGAKTVRIPWRMPPQRGITGQLVAARPSSLLAVGLSLAAGIARKDHRQHSAVQQRFHSHQFCFKPTDLIPGVTMRSPEQNLEGRNLSSKSSLVIGTDKESNIV